MIIAFYCILFPIQNYFFLPISNLILFIFSFCLLFFKHWRRLLFYLFTFVFFFFANAVKLMTLLSNDYINYATHEIQYNWWKKKKKKKKITVFHGKPHYIVNLFSKCVSFGIQYMECIKITTLKYAVTAIVISTHIQIAIENKSC